MSDNREYREASEAAASHRQRAGELYAQHRSEGKDELLTQAREEYAKATHFEEKAQGAQGGQKQDTFQRDGEAAGDSDRRAWYEPGSVADDKMLQFEEAKQGGILDEVTKYAARSVFDKDHRKFEAVGKGAKAVGKGAKAVGKGTQAVGKGAKAVGENSAKTVAKGAKAVGQGAKAVGKGTQAVGKAAKAVGEKSAKAVTKGAKAVGRGASSPFKAARDYAASRGSKAGPTNDNRSKSVLQECGQKKGRNAPAKKQKTQGQQKQRSAKPQREPER